MPDFSKSADLNGKDQNCLKVQILLLCLFGVFLAAVANAQAANRKLKSSRALAKRIRFQDLGYKPPVPMSYIDLKSKSRPGSLHVWMYLYYDKAWRKWLGPKVDERQKILGMQSAGRLIAEMEKLEKESFQHYLSPYQKLPGESKVFSVFQNDLCLAPGPDLPGSGLTDHYSGGELHFFTPQHDLGEDVDDADVQKVMIDRMRKVYPQARWLIDISRLVSANPNNVHYQEKQIRALAQYLQSFGVQSDIKPKQQEGKIIGYSLRIQPTPPDKEPKHWAAKLAYRLSKRDVPASLSFQTWSENLYNSSTDYFQNPVSSELILPVLAAINPLVINWHVERELYRSHQQRYQENRVDKYTHIGEEAWPKQAIKITNRRHLWHPEFKEKAPQNVRTYYATRNAFHLDQIGAALRDAVYVQGVITLEEDNNLWAGSSDLEALFEQTHENARELADYAYSVYKTALEEYNKRPLQFRVVRKSKSAYEMLEVPVNSFEAIQIYIPKKSFVVSESLEQQFYSRQVEKELLAGFAWILDYRERLHSGLLRSWAAEKMTCYNLFHLADREVERQAESEDE